jgi:hypothetical protein
MNIPDYMSQYNLQKDNPEELSNIGVKLAADIFYHSTKVAQSELLEKTELVKLLTPVGEEKKLSVAESEVKAVVSTGNVYGTDKINLEAAYEVLNMLKTRIKVLITERESQKGAL